MSRRAKTDEELAAEAAARRVELREEQAAHGRTWKALREANRMLLCVVLADRLGHPGDLELYVPLEDLTDETGRLVWARVQAVVDELLLSRPNLATPTSRVAGARSDWGLHSERTGLVVGAVASRGPEQAAQGATRSEPGAGADGTHPTELP